MLAYLAPGAAALLLGAAATSSGLTVALELGSPAIVLVCVAALVLALVSKRPRPADPEPVVVVDAVPASPLVSGPRT